MTSLLDFRKRIILEHPMAPIKKQPRVTVHTSESLLREVWQFFGW